MERESFVARLTRNAVARSVCGSYPCCFSVLNGRAFELRSVRVILDCGRAETIFSGRVAPVARRCSLLPAGKAAWVAVNGTGTRHTAGNELAAPAAPSVPVVLPLRVQVSGWPRAD